MRLERPVSLRVGRDLQAPFKKVYGEKVPLPTGRRGLTGTVESFAATVRNIVQLGMGGFPRLRQQPKKNPRKQLPAKLQQARSLLTTIIGSCLKYMQVEAFRARSARLQDSTVVTTTVFGVVRLCGAFSTSQLHLLSRFAFFSSKGIPTPELLYSPAQQSWSTEGKSGAGQVPRAAEVEYLTNLRKVEGEDPVWGPGDLSLSLSFRQG